MTTIRDMADRLASRYPPSFCRQLAESPREALSGRGISLVPFELEYARGDCSCDGVFHPGPPPVIGYRPTPRSRRESFTLVHEFGHFATRGDDDTLSELADFDDDGGREAEERVCDALAGMILVPETKVDSVVGGDRPLARHLEALYQASGGSREACAVRLAERLTGFGYVAIIDTRTESVRFASPSPSNPYRWRRGTPIGSSTLWRARDRGEYRGQAPVVWPSGQKRELWVDAITRGNTIHAVFSDRRPWDDGTLSLLDGGVRPARGTAYRGTCPHCGASKWGYRLHPPCEETFCQSCGKCGCDAPSRPSPETRVCADCGLSKRASLFPNDEAICRDCAE